MTFDYYVKITKEISVEGSDEEVNENSNID